MSEYRNEAEAEDVKFKGGVWEKSLHSAMQATMLKASGWWTSIENDISSNQSSVEPLKK